MNRITKNNYEAYLLDYVEENLSSELVAELMVFLENNSELKEELSNYENFSLEPSTEVFSNKQDLKIEENKISLLTVEDFMIAEIEGVNTKEESEALSLFIAKNPTQKKIVEAYQKTKLVAPILLFEDKKSLKRKEGKIIPLYWWYSSAAAILIILFLVKSLNGDDKNKVMPFAEKENTTIPRHSNKVQLKKNDPVLEQEEVAVIVKEQVPSIVKQQPSINKKTPKTQAVEEKEVNTELANHSVLPIENVKDSLPPAIPPKKLDEPEPLLTDNVKITYEEEPAPVSPQPLTKAKIVKEIVTQRLKNKFLKQQKNENGEVVAYAVNVAGIEFIKHKKKNKN